MHYVIKIFLLVVFVNVSMAQTVNNFSKPVYFTKDNLIADIEEYKKVITELHVQPFDHIRRDSFVNHLESLKKDAVKYDIDELYLRLMQINAELQDEHTFIFFSHINAFKYKCYWFDEGVYITETTAENAPYLFSKIIAVNNIPIEGVIDRIGSIISDKNSASFKAYIPDYIFEPYALHGIGISASDTIMYTVVTTKNDTVTFSTSVNDTKNSQKILNRDDPDFLRNKKDGNYWYEYLNGCNAIYFKYSLAHNDTLYPFKAMLHYLMGDILTKKPDKLIIDLRDNTGGSISMLSRLIGVLKESDIQKKNGIYVLVGRETFSAAVLNAITCKKILNAQIVGEETAGSVSHYGLPKFVFLPNTGLKMMYSTKFVPAEVNYQGSLQPDVIIKEKLSDYMLGVDAALQYSLSH